MQSVTFTKNLTSGLEHTSFSFSRKHHDQESSRILRQQKIITSPHHTPATNLSSRVRNLTIRVWRDTRNIISCRTALANAHWSRAQTKIFAAISWSNWHGPDLKSQKKKKKKPQDFLCAYMCFICRIMLFEGKKKENDNDLPTAHVVD